MRTPCLWGNVSGPVWDKVSITELKKIWCEHHSTLLILFGRFLNPAFWSLFDGTPILTNRSCCTFVTFEGYTSNFKSLSPTVLEIFCLQTDTRTKMAETLNKGSSSFSSPFPVYRRGRRFSLASQSALTRVIALGWHLVVATNYEWMPFALNLCYFFSKGNSLPV
jgi:hypothetical protein